MATLQIRNLPQELHRALKVRAALEGKSMSELVIDQLRVTLALPTERELQDRMGRAEPIRMHESSATLIRQERDAA